MLFSLTTINRCNVFLSLICIVVSYNCNDWNNKKVIMIIVKKTDLQNNVINFEFKVHDKVLLICPPETEVYVHITSFGYMLTQANCFLWTLFGNVLWRMHAYRFSKQTIEKADHRDNMEEVHFTYEDHQITTYLRKYVCICI